MIELNARAFSPSQLNLVTCSFEVTLLQSDVSLNRLLKMAWPADSDAVLKADASTKNKAATIMVRSALAS